MLQYILFAFVLIMQPYVTDGTLVYVLLSKNLNRVLYSIVLLSKNNEKYP